MTVHSQRRPKSPLSRYPVARKHVEYKEGKIK